MQKTTIISIIISIALIGGAIMFASGDGPPSTENVSIENGTQIIEVTAKGKYSPRLTAAKAGMPTILRVKTMGTYDCTAALKVPNIGYEKMLPPTGTTDIELPAQNAGAVVQGICAMGMYNFKVGFN